MKIFYKYLFINIILIFFHALMFFIGVMGFGGRSGSEDTWYLVYNILLFGTFGASPNLIVFLFAFINKKDIKLNFLWATTFFFLVLACYFIMFWSVLRS